MSRKKIILIFFVTIAIGFLSLNTFKKDDVLLGSQLDPIGRTFRMKDDRLILISSAAHFGFTFEGKEGKLYAAVDDWQDHNYLQYEIDGVYQKRIRIDKNSKKPFVIATEKAGKHTVWIYKATEAHSGPIYIGEVRGNKLQSIKPSSAPLIEFIGNSITCGAAADPSEVPCGTGLYHDQHNAYMAYGPRVARALNVNFVMNSVSGIGIYRNWNSDGPTMPQVYDHSDFQLNSPGGWADIFKPKIISIALGTNDFSNGDGKKQRLPFDSVQFVDNYIKFLQFIKSKNPDAKIALLSSPMINGERRILLQNCLTTIKNAAYALWGKDAKVETFFFKPMQARGCTGHPNVEDHAIIAEEVIPFFKNLLKD